MPIKRKIFDGVQDVIDTVKSWVTSGYAPKNHKHISADVTDFSSQLVNVGMGSMPDYSRARTMYTQLENMHRRCNIYKINVPGYIAYPQNNYILDTDYVIYVAEHPGYLYFPWNETIHIRSNGSNTTVARPRYLSNRAIIGGSAVNGGDTFNSMMYPIMPGTSTYVLPTCTFGGSGWQYHRWIFIPCKGVPTGISADKYFTHVGCAEYTLARDDGTDGCGYFNNSALRGAFSGDWTNNLTNNEPIYVHSIFVQGTRWNWNSVQDSANGSTIGVRFVMFDATATGKDRRWLQYNDRSNRQIYWDSAGYWALGEGNKQMYRANDANGSKNPWELTWYNSYDTNTAVCTMVGKIQL